MKARVKATGEIVEVIAISDYINENGQIIGEYKDGNECYTLLTIWISISKKALPSPTTGLALSISTQEWLTEMEKVIIGNIHDNKEYLEENS